MIAFYAYELILIAKVEPRRTIVCTRYSAACDLCLPEGPTRREKVVAVVLEVEKWTAPLRRDDDLLCRYGLEEMTTALERRTQKEIPNVGTLRQDGVGLASA